MRSHVALDFESEWSKTLSVQIQGNALYAAQTHIFSVAIYTVLDGTELAYVGPLEEAPWDKINGLDWCAHNASFDSSLFYAGRDIHHQIPSHIEPARVDCTADMAAYVLLGRSLENAVKHAYGQDLSKDVRAKSKGKHWPDDFSEEERQEFWKYNLADAQWCWRLWEDFSDAWPIVERDFAQIIRARCHSGIALDLDGLEAGIVRMQEVKDSAEDAVPWPKVLSPKAVREYCAAQGIPAPKSLAQNNETCAEWEAQYGEKFPIIGAIRQYRKANMYLRKLHSMQRRVVPGTKRMDFSLLYHGAAGTGRLSGAAGVNLQNLPRTSFEELDLRGLFIAGPERKFVIGDFAAIEPRGAAWMTQNITMLKALRQGYNFYESDARQAGVWDGEPGTFKKTDPKAYQLQKATTLGVAYGMGIERFQRTVKTQLGLDLSVTRCRQIIDDWHARNPGVKIKWRHLDQALNMSHARHEPLELELPSDRSLWYFDINYQDGGFTACPTRGGVRKHFWGGVLFENVIQAVARDVLRDTVLRLEAAGIPVLFTSHDECVCEVPLETDKSVVRDLMLVPPSWAPDLPLEVEVTETGRYTK